MAERSLITLITSDSVKVEVDSRISNLSGLIKDILEDSGTSEELPLPRISKQMLDILLEFTYHHNFNLPSSIPRPLNKTNFSEIIEDPWDVEFINRFSQEELNHLLVAADFMNFKPVLDLGCAFIASKLKGKEPETLLEEWEITEEITPEDDDKLKQENPWAFEGEYEPIRNA